MQKVKFDADLIRRYDHMGPRYTSYPTADRFSEEVNEADYRNWVKSSNEDPIPRPLSVYVHIPFCDTVCFYCACNKIVTGDYSRAVPYLNHLYREIEIQGPLFDSDRCVHQLHWGGGTPTFLDSDQIRSLMEVLGRYFQILDNNSGEYSIEVDPRSVEREKLETLRNVGFNRISFGVQDLNADVQKAVNRVQPEALTPLVVARARALGFDSVNLDLMYGLPLQTAVTFRETLDRVIEINPDRIAVYNYAHLPERFKPQRRIREEQMPSAGEKLNILQQTIEQLTSAGYVYIGMDHFARAEDDLAIAQKQGVLHRNFQGYSTQPHCDLVAMGVSAIGHISDNYIQNTRDINKYYEFIDEGKLPFHRGIELTPEDLLRRQIIHTLICHFVLNISELEQQWRIDFFSSFAGEIDQLEVMAADGLLEIGAETLLVLPAGRLLIRNICLVFDRYAGAENAQRKYSKTI